MTVSLLLHFQDAFGPSGRFILDLGAKHWTYTEEYTQHPLTVTVQQPDLVAVVYLIFSARPAPSYDLCLAKDHDVWKSVRG